MFASGCYGPFSLTRRLYRWNSQAGDKWAQEFMFLVLTWVPVYGLATLADAVVFNSFQFWTGKNPVETSSQRSTRSMAQRLARGGDQAMLTYAPVSDGAELFIEQFQEGRAAGSLRIQRRGSAAVGLDGNGQMLFTAQSLVDGSVLIRDRNGKQMAAYSADQVDRILGSAGR